MQKRYQTTYTLTLETLYESISAFVMSALSVGSTIIADDGAVKPNFFMDAYVIGHTTWRHIQNSIRYAFRLFQPFPGGTQCSFS